MTARTCSAPTAAHDALDARAVLLVMAGQRRPATLCRGCRSRMAEMGFAIEEERRDLATRPATFPPLRLRRAA